MIKPLTTRQFQRLRDLIHKAAGIFLADSKQPLLAGRLARRLRKLGLTSFDEYYDKVAEGDSEMNQMLDHISTNTTRFFREAQHFEFLRDYVFPAWTSAAAKGARARRVRVWSAGCSTGEEPYSLAMTLLDHLPDWDIEVQATDLSTRALEQARCAIWPLEHAEEIPPAYLRKFMLKGRNGQSGKMRAGVMLRSIVNFRWLNLNDPGFEVGGRFDLIFCRNVMIYFQTDLRRRLVDRLIDHLQPNGLLFIGHAETLTGITTRLRSFRPTIYGLNR